MFLIGGYDGQLHYHDGGHLNTSGRSHGCPT